MNNTENHLSLNPSSPRLTREVWKLIFIIACYLFAGMIALKFHAILSDYERDATEMLFDAKRILAGEGYNSDFWPFGYMATIAFLKFITGMDFFTSGKLITLFSGAGILMLTYLIGKQVFSEKIAILAVLILASNHFFFSHSFLVEMDMLFTLLLLVSVYFLIKGNEWRNFLLSGAFAGISYMVKYGTYALFPVVAAVALINISDRGLIDSSKKAMVFFAAFFVFSSPWLINNTIKNGSPFYSKHYVNVAWGMNRPQPMPDKYWVEYFRLNEEYASMKEVVADTKKFVGNWLNNIRRLPANMSDILSVTGIFVLPAFLMAFGSLDRRRLILILLTLSYLSLVTMAYTWNRYLIPLMPVLCIFIAFFISEVLPESFSLRKLTERLSFNIPFRIIIVALLVLFSAVKSFDAVTEFMRKEHIYEWKVAGEWLKPKLKNDDWIMVPKPQTAWFAGTDKFVKYPTDASLPLKDVVRKREQNTFFFWQETLTTKIVTDVDYVIYDEHWWKWFLPTLLTKNGPIVPDNFVPVFSTKGSKTHIIIYKIIHE